MKKQTAVEWLIEQFEKDITFRDDEWEILNKAKEMEKEQLINFFQKGQSIYPSEFPLINEQIAEQHFEIEYHRPYNKEETK